MSGAGGTSGGVKEFFIGLLMAVTGGYLLLKNIVITSAFSFRHPFWWGSNGGGFLQSVPAGVLFIPFLFGVGLIFYNFRSILGWVLMVGSIIAIIFDVLMNLHISMRSMTMLDIVIIFVLLAGGVGLFLRSLREHS